MDAADGGRKRIRFNEMLERSEAGQQGVEMNYLHLSPEGSEVEVSRVIGTALRVPWGPAEGLPSP